MPSRPPTRPQGPDVQEPLGHAGRPGRQRRHGRHDQDARPTPSGSCSNTSGAALHLLGLRLPDWAADIGNRAYQDRWAANVLAKLLLTGWDGVFVDDTNPTMQVPLQRRSGREVPDRRRVLRRDRLGALGHRPASARRRQARHPELRRLARLPHRRQQLAARTSPAAWRSSSPSGATDPAAATSPAATGTPARAAQGDAGGQGKLFLGDHPLRPATTRPPPATAGRRCCSPRPADTRPSRCRTTTRTRRGSPSTTTTSAMPPAPRPRSPSGVHRRVFQRGLVLVNPTNAQRVRELRRPLPRLRPRPPPARTTMAPHTGLILTRDGGRRRPRAAPAAPTCRRSSSHAASARRRPAPTSARPPRPPRPAARPPTVDRHHRAPQAAASLAAASACLPLHGASVPPARHGGRAPARASAVGAVAAR